MIGLPLGIEKLLQLDAKKGGSELPKIRSLEFNLYVVAGFVRTTCVSGWPGPNLIADADV
jgi:hypothetical protein